MSADSHTVCPACHPDVLDYTGPEHYPMVPAGVMDHCAEELGYDRSVRENIDYYLLAKDKKLVLVFEYNADCWTCDWHYETTLEQPIPGLVSPTRTVADVLTGPYMPDRQVKDLCTKCQRPRGEHAAVKWAIDKHWCPSSDNQSFSETEYFTP